jgi:hypothetical protein
VDDISECEEKQNGNFHSPTHHHHHPSLTTYPNIEAQGSCHPFLLLIAKTHGRYIPIPPVIHYVRLAPARPVQHPILKFLHKVKNLFQWKRRGGSDRGAGVATTNSMAMDDTESLADTYESDFASSVSVISDI